MGDAQPTVYLEDIEPPVKSAKKERQDTAPLPPTASTTSVKRQRTLVDMLSGSQESTSTRPAAKKVKLSASTSAVSTNSATGSTGRLRVAGLPKLNSIPFSLTSFQASLSEEHRNLLNLECEVMGKSW